MNVPGQPVYDGGTAFINQAFGVAGVTVSSADASSTTLVFTDAPADTGQKIVLDDVEISVDTAMTVTLRTHTTHSIIGKYYLPANSVFQSTLRGKRIAKDAGETLEALTSASGNISISASYHSEP